MNQLQYLLARADAQLEQINVSGADVYRMVNARNIIKSVYDALQDEKPKEVSDDG